jgi:hypothetical protein
MKHSTKIFIGSLFCAACLVIAPQTQGAWGHGGGGHYGGGWGGGHHGWGGRGYGWGYGGWGWGWGWPWGLSFSYYGAPYYYYPYGYYYAPPSYDYYYSAPPVAHDSQAPVVYSSPPASSTAEYDSTPAPPPSDSSQRGAVDRPLSPTAVDRDSPPPSYNAPPPRSSSMVPALPVQGSIRFQAGSPADIKALAKAGLSDEVILSHIRNSHAVYHLTTAEIIDLKQSGVSDKAIDFMINTASGNR